MECPICNLINPESAQRCDCGYGNAPRKQADESAQCTHIANSTPTKAEFKPSGDLKKLYREAAKQIHPDLAKDKEEQMHQQKPIVKANVAHDAGIA
jgi:hypothetical protein